MSRVVERPSVRFSPAVFSELYPNGSIKRTLWSILSPELVVKFEAKSQLFIHRRNYRPGNFEAVFVIKHENGDKTFAAQQIKTYDPDGDTEQLTHFVDQRKRELIGHSELRYNFSHDIPYFKDKPFVGYNTTYDGYQSQGLGRRRLVYMNAFSRMCYGLPLYSDTHLTDSAEKLWRALVKEGLARKFTEKEGAHTRFVFKKKSKTPS